MTTEELLDVFRTMTVLELSDFLKAFETEFGVSATPPTAVLPPPGVEVAPVEEPTEFNVMLLSFGAQKIQVIKEARALAGLGLKEAKELVESVPVAFLTEVDSEHAEAARTLLEKAGADVQVVPVPAS